MWHCQSQNCQCQGCNCFLEVYSAVVAAVVVDLKVAEIVVVVAVEPVVAPEKLVVQPVEPVEPVVVVATVVAVIAAVADMVE